MKTAAFIETLVAIQVFYMSDPSQLLSFSDKEFNLLNIFNDILSTTIVIWNIFRNGITVTNGVLLSGRQPSIPTLS
jgi:hypothetical protein